MMALALVLCDGFLQGASGMIAPEAKTYLDAALEIIQKNSIKHETDWAAMRKLAYDRAGAAQRPSETYGAIREALAFLGDHHSFFLDSAQNKKARAAIGTDMGGMCLDGYLVWVIPGSPADKAGLKPGMKLIELDGQALDAANSRTITRDKPFTLLGQLGTLLPKTYTVRPSDYVRFHAPTGRMLPGDYALLTVPEFMGEEKFQKRYAQALQDLIRKFDRPELKGWILDLRLNGGGNMWPMIAGLGPLYPEGFLGEFVSATGRTKWFYRKGKSMVEQAVCAVTPKPYVLKRNGLPIAVLTDQYTASSGEATLISFRGLPNARSFGMPTAGLPTGNQNYDLSDGAVILLCVVFEADRTGKTYDSKMPPDVEVKSDWSKYQQDDDPVIARAVEWLSASTGR